MPRSRRLNPQRRLARYSAGMNITTAITATNTVTRPRSVERLVQGQATSDGAGVKLVRVLTQNLQRRRSEEHTSELQSQ